MKYLTLALLLLAGCQEVKQEIAQAPPDARPPLYQARALGPAQGDVRVVCWRVDGPGNASVWSALCVPVQAIRACVETETALHCSTAAARDTT